jgi:hypothetical protein
MEKEKKTLNDQIVSWKKKLAQQQQVNANLSTALKNLASKANGLQREQKSLVSFSGRQFEDFSIVLRSTMSAGLLTRIRRLEDETKASNDKYLKEMAERKKLHNLVQELKGNIRVFMRCRPPTSKELEQLGECLPSFLRQRISCLVTFMLACYIQAMMHYV